jgi:Putative transposase
MGSGSLRRVSQLSKQPRCALLEGFSLHANTHLHANDRQGLERPGRYGARGALALERLSRAEDGRIAYRMKRPLPGGTTHLFFTELELPRAWAGPVKSCSDRGDLSQTQLSNAVRDNSACRSIFRSFR